MDNHTLKGVFNGLPYMFGMDHLNYAIAKVSRRIEQIEDQLEQGEGK